MINYARNFVRSTFLTLVRISLSSSVFFSPYLNRFSSQLGREVEQKRACLSSHHSYKPAHKSTLCCLLLTCSFCHVALERGSRGLEFSALPFCIDLHEKLATYQVLSNNNNNHGQYLHNFQNGTLLKQTTTTSPSSTTINLGSGGSTNNLPRFGNSNDTISIAASSPADSQTNDDIKKHIYLRNLCPNDINELKTLCAEWFPVDYPDQWYKDITSSQRFFSLAAIYQSRIIGMIVAEIKLKKNVDHEDWFILSRKHSPNTQITYILSLGVFKEFRRLGIGKLSRYGDLKRSGYFKHVDSTIKASLLLDTLLDYLKAETDCKAVYLHVLCSNTNAITFYEKRDFEQRMLLPNYYTIKGQLHDGYCYVLYMNGGEPPWTFTEIIKASWSFLKANNPCKLLFDMSLVLNNWLRHNRNYLPTKDFYRIS